MEIVDDSGFDSDHKTSASALMAEESEQNKITEVCYITVYKVYHNCDNLCFLIRLILMALASITFTGTILIQAMHNIYTVIFKCNFCVKTSI